VPLKDNTNINNFMDSEDFIDLVSMLLQIKTSKVEEMKMTLWTLNYHQMAYSLAKEATSLQGWANARPLLKQRHLLKTSTCLKDPMLWANNTKIWEPRVTQKYTLKIQREICNYIKIRSMLSNVVLQCLMDTEARILLWKKHLFPHQAIKKTSLFQFMSNPLLKSFQLEYKRWYMIIVAVPTTTYSTLSWRTLKKLTSQSLKLLSQKSVIRTYSHSQSLNYILLNSSRAQHTH